MNGGEDSKLLTTTEMINTSTGFQVINSLKKHQNAELKYPLKAAMISQRNILHKLLAVDFPWVMKILGCPSARDHTPHSVQPRVLLKCSHSFAVVFQLTPPNLPSRAQNWFRAAQEVVLQQPDPSSIQCTQQSK